MECPYNQNCSFFQESAIYVKYHESSKEGESGAPLLQKKVEMILVLEMHYSSLSDESSRYLWKIFTVLEQRELCKKD